MMRLLHIEFSKYVNDLNTILQLHNRLMDTKLNLIQKFVPILVKKAQPTTISCTTYVPVKATLSHDIVEYR